MATGEPAAVEAVNAASSSKESKVPQSSAAQGNAPAQRGPSRAMEVASLRSKYIGAGDLVIVWMSRDKTPTPLTVTPGAELFNNYGCFSHDAMIGLPFGSKLASRNRRGFVFLLRPSPEMWTLALPHRTQILYAPDMAFIASHLGLGPGARVIEAGTGSGSFTHFLARTVGRKHEQIGGWGWKGGPPRKKRQNQLKKKKSRRGGSDRRAEAMEEDLDSGAQEDSDDNNDDDEEGNGQGSEDVEEGLEDPGKNAESIEPADEGEREILKLLGAAPDANVSPRQGRVWTFEFHAARAVQAYQEFEAHGLVDKLMKPEEAVETNLDPSTASTSSQNRRDRTVSLRHRNVIKDGFGLENCADALFLDVPAPWDAIRHAAKALRKDIACRICCFSPCIEQVLKTVTALREVASDGASSSNDEHEGNTADAAVRWTDIETYECLMRTHMSVKVGPGQYNEMKPITEAIERIREVEVRKARRRDIQIARARKEREAKLSGETGAGAEGDSNTVGAGDEDEDMDEEGEGSSHLRGTKRPLESEADDNDGGQSHAGSSKAANGNASEKDRGKSKAELELAAIEDGSVRIYSKPFAEMRGHTSYLTFATLIPRVIRQEADPTLEKEKEAARRKAANEERIRLRREEREKNKALEANGASVKADGAGESKKEEQMPPKEQLKNGVTEEQAKIITTEAEGQIGTGEEQRPRT